MAGIEFKVDARLGNTDLLQQDIDSIKLQPLKLTIDNRKAL